MARAATYREGNTRGRTAKASALGFIALLTLVWLVSLASVRVVYAQSPQIALNPVTSPPLSLINITGSGFAPSSAIILYQISSAGGTFTMCQISADSGGSFKTRCPTGESPTAIFTIRAQDQKGNSATASLKIVPIVYDPVPPTGPRGTKVVLTGRGFAAYSQISVKFDSTAVAGTTNTSNYGSWRTGNYPITIVVPSTNPGSHVITATDGAGNSASTNFIVPQQQISVNPSQGPVGTSPSMRGDGFLRYSPIAVKFDGQPVSCDRCDPNTGIVGAGMNFELHFVVPNSTSGPHIVSATDSAGNTATSTFTINSGLSTSSTGSITGSSTGTSTTSTSASIVKNLSVTSSVSSINSSQTETAASSSSSVGGGAQGQVSLWELLLIISVALVTSGLLWYIGVLRKRAKLKASNGKPGTVGKPPPTSPPPPPPPKDSPQRDEKPPTIYAGEEKVEYTYEASLHVDITGHEGGMGHANADLKKTKVTKDASGKVVKTEIEEVVYDFSPKSVRYSFLQALVIGGVDGLVVKSKPYSTPPIYATNAYYAITQEGYDRAEQWADSKVKSPPDYIITRYNCVDFSLELVRTAGALPPSAGHVSTPGNLAAAIEHANCAHSFELERSEWDSIHGWRTYQCVKCGFIKREIPGLR